MYVRIEFFKDHDLEMLQDRINMFLSDIPLLDVRVQYSTFIDPDYGVEYHCVLSVFEAVGTEIEELIG